VIGKGKAVFLVQKRKGVWLWVTKYHPSLKDHKKRSTLRYLELIREEVGETLPRGEGVWDPLKRYSEGDASK